MGLKPRFWGKNEMAVKVAILGPGEISIISKYSKAKEKEVKEFIEEFGKWLAGQDIELIIAVDRGIAFEIAKVYKKNNGKKVYGVNPQSHEKYNKEEAIKPFMEVVDEEIKVSSWYHLNGEIASFSDISVSLGLSCGTMADIVFLYFHYKYLGCKTKLLMYLPFMSSELPPEVEQGLSIKGRKFEYVSSISELKEKILEN